MVKEDRIHSITQHFMKAIALTRYLPISDPQSLVDVELPKPSPLENDLLVRVEAVSVNPADTKVRAPKERFAPPIAKRSDQSTLPIYAASTPRSKAGVLSVKLHWRGGNSGLATQLVLDLSKISQKGQTTAKQDRSNQCNRSKT